jgi:hypothetical protein
MKIDLHIHTLVTESDNGQVFNLEFLKSYIEDKKIDSIAITNHNIFNRDQFDMISCECQNCLVLPGIEASVESGHLLLISSLDKLDDFALDCDKFNVLFKDKPAGYSVSLDEFLNAFGDIDDPHYLLIPHFKKDPISKALPRLLKHYFCGEAGGPGSFIRMKKDLGSPVPVLFSDFRCSSMNFRSRQTYVLTGEKTFASLWTSLHDKAKVSLCEPPHGQLFKISLDNKEIFGSTGLNVILGKRSSGKTFLLNSIFNQYGTSGGEKIKYIRQFELVEKEDSEYQKSASDIENRICQETSVTFLSQLRKHTNEILLLDCSKTQKGFDDYAEKLKDFALNQSNLDIYSKVPLFSESKSREVDLTATTNVLNALKTLLDTNDLDLVAAVSPFLDRNSVMKAFLAVSSYKRQKRIEKVVVDSGNDLINKIKADLQVSSKQQAVPQSSFEAAAKELFSISQFNSLVNRISQISIAATVPVGSFFVQVSTLRITSSTMLKNYLHCPGSWVNAFKLQGNPFQLAQGIKAENLIPDGDIFKCFFEFSPLLLNKYNQAASGGEYAEFNLEAKLSDARNYSCLLVDEPEGAFDNPFLKLLIDTRLKDLSAFMPVFLATHNPTVGISIQPDYLIYTEAETDDDSKTKHYHLYEGTFGDKHLIDPFCEKTVSSRDKILSCFEAGEDTYMQRGDFYASLKN